MKKRILGLDPGLAILGFGTICYQAKQPPLMDLSNSSNVLAKVVNKSVSLLDFGVIKTNAKEEMGKRLCIIYDDLNTLWSNEA